MLVSLADVLALPTFEAARPEVVHGNPATTLIRWVHSSEVFEIAPLLKGGELLLTTGLGLRGASAPTLRRYVNALADAGVRALGLELGRTFLTPPDALVRTARERGLALVAFPEIVPFESMSEAFHELLLDRRIEALQASERVWRVLLAGALAGEGLQGAVHRASELSGRPVRLVARDDRVVATTEENGTFAALPEVWSEYPISLGDSRWGTLAVGGERDPLTDAVGERAATVVGLELSRAGNPPDRLAKASALLGDIVNNRLPSVEEVRIRCELAGFRAQQGVPIAAVAFAGERDEQSHRLARSAEQAGREIFGSCFVGELGDDIVVLLRAPEHERELRDRAQQMYHRLAQHSGGSEGRAVVAAAGAPVRELEALPQTIGQAQESVAIARRLGIRGQVLLANDLGAYRLLSKFQSEPEMLIFLREQLGALLDHDAAHRSDLVRTLDAYLAHGLSKAETARALGIRRQTLYNRLANIEEILGPVALTDHNRRTALSLALHAWRLRTGLGPEAP